MRNKVLWRMTATMMAVLVAFDASAVTARASDVGQAVEVPAEVREISEELGNQYHICPELIQAVCFKESSFRADAVNGDYVGIMQVSEKWHRERMERLGVSDLTDTEGNMRVAVDYLSTLVEDGEDMEEALMRYHGESRIMERLSEGELSEYVDQVLTVSAMLERRSGK